MTITRTSCPDTFYTNSTPVPTITVNSDVGTLLYDSLDREILVRRPVGYGAPVKKSPPKSMPKSMPSKKSMKKGCK